MGTTDDFATLRGSRLTNDLSDEQVHHLAAIFHCRILQDDEVLFEEGQVDQALHVLTSGKLVVTRDVAGGERVILHILQAGDLAGEMGFVGGRPHSATVRALGRPTVCSMERDRFEALIGQDPWLVYRVMQNIVKGVHDILRRMNTQYVEMSNYITRQHGRY